MNRFAAPSAVEVLIFFVLFGAARPQRVHAFLQGAAAGQPDKPCAYLSKADAESMLGRRVVSRSDNDYECWFWQEGFAGGATADNKQVHLSIWRYTSPQPSGIDAIRAAWARQQVSARNLTGFGDAALWSWLPGTGGTLEAFKGGTLQVEVTISGLPEDTTLQNAKSLAARVLGGSGGTGYDYAKASAMKAAQERAAATTVQSPGSYREGWLRHNIVVRGTVSRLEIKSTGYPKWLTIHFKESPNDAFVVCSPYPDMFTETVGDLYRMVGKILEVKGPVGSAMCADKGASINVVESGGYRVEGLQAASAAMAEGSLPISKTNGARLGLDICNSGNAPFDAVVAKHGRAAMTHILPAQCAHVYEDTDGPASVGFALADSRGQWGPVRRVELLAVSSEIWSKGAGEPMSVRRGNTNVSVPAQMLFRPPRAVCHTNSTDSAESQLPFGASAAQVRSARQADSMARSSTSSTVCDSVEYDLNVVAYPDTREVTFQNKCYACPPTRSPAELAQGRADMQQTTRTMSRMSPMAGGIMDGVIARAQDQAVQDSLQGPPEFRHMDWDELHRALGYARGPGGGRPPQIPQYLAISGTVSRVDVLAGPAGTNIAGAPWVNVYFRESAERAGTSYGKFNVCTIGTDIFEGMFGPDFRTRMIGQVLAVEGEYGQGCMGWKGGIRISLAHQVRRVAGR